jgi:lipopolysaccharide transport protein LptA
LSAARLLWLSLLLPGLSALGRKSPTETAGKPARPDVPVQVRCDDMVVENRQSLARCEGHVVAVRQNVTVTCDRAVAHYDEAGRVTDLTCNGHVHVVQKPLQVADGAAPKAPNTADGDKGVYLEGARTLTLTGHATLEQGEDRLHGEPIVFFVDEDRVVAKDARMAGRLQDAQKPSSAPKAPASKGGQPQ